MSQPGSSARLLADPVVVVGQVAALLAAGGSLRTALQAVADGLSLRSALVRRPGGDLVAVGGDVLHVVPTMRALPTTPSMPAPTIELPAHGRDGALVASLVVAGARPSQLPTLRALAAVVGLSLAAQAPGDSRVLLDDSERARDELADALHDGPLQHLVAARYATDAVVRGGDPTHARDAVQQALVEARRALWQLRSRGAQGLGTALSELSVKQVEAGRPPVTVNGPADDLVGPPGVLAYRVVQAVATSDDPVRVTALADGDDPGVVVVVIDGGAPLAAADRWTLRARALGGSLSTSAGRVRLVLPSPDPRMSP